MGKKPQGTLSITATSSKDISQSITTDMQHSGATQHIPFPGLPANSSEKIKVLLTTCSKKASTNLLKRPILHSLFKQKNSQFLRKKMTTFLLLPPSKGYIQTTLIKQKCNSGPLDQDSEDVLQPMLFTVSQKIPLRSLHF